MPAKRNLVGQTHGRLTVLEQCDQAPVRWRCRCSCGNFKEATTRDLLSGHVQSCGCWQRESRHARIRHGFARRGSKHPVYVAWKHMIARCYDVNNEKYKDYGARGIEVCKRWHVFENFYADMGERPGGRSRRKSMWSVERRNNNGHYEPGNVVWGTQLEQARNTRRVHAKRRPECHPERAHEARGLCRPCYYAAWSRGELG